MSPAGDYTLGARPARPQSPERPCHSSPPPRAHLPHGTVSALSPRLPAGNRARPAELGRAKEEPARHSCPAAPGSGAGPGRTGPKSASRTHLSLRLRAGGTGAQTPRATSSARAQRADSLRARSRQTPIGCALRKLTNTVAPWLLSSPPMARSRVPKVQSEPRKGDQVTTVNSPGFRCYLGLYF